MENNGVGRRIQECRRNMKMSREALAEEVGLSTSAISYIERGTSYPTLQNFIKIANVLHVSADTLLFDEIDASMDNSNTEFARIISSLPAQKKKKIKNLLEVLIKTNFFD